MAAPDTEPLSVLGIAGSLRQGSFNRELIRAASELAPDLITVSSYPLNDIPLYNADLETGDDPQPVAHFKEAIANADGVLVASPEYNHGMTGVLKNALDWASRPARESVLRDKPMAIVGATPGRGGTIRAQMQVRQTLEAIGAYVLPQPEYYLPGIREKVDDEGRLTDQASRNYLRRFLEAFGDWIQKFND